MVLSGPKPSRRPGTPAAGQAGQLPVVEAILRACRGDDGAAGGGPVARARTSAEPGGAGRGEAGRAGTRSPRPAPPAQAFSVMAVVGQACRQRPQRRQAFASATTATDPPKAKTPYGHDERQ